MDHSSHFLISMAPGTSAQRSREHRKKVKEDPEKYQLYLKKEKERYKRRKEEGKLKAKKNFFLLTTIPFNFGFERLTWNFLEAGHGKGPADGVGAAVKRRADALVAQGTDLPCAEVLFQALSAEHKKVNLFYVQEEEIEANDKLIPKQLSTIRGTMKIYQV